MIGMKTESTAESGGNFFTQEETEARVERVVKRMLATPPQPHPKATPGRKAGRPIG
jgi:hypothetical protein